MMKITSFGAAILLGLLLLASSRVLSFGHKGVSRWLVILGVVIFTAGLIYQIQQHKARRTQAKQGLIAIESALQVFQEDAYVPGKSLYPLDWQSVPGKDWSVAISILSLVGLTVLVILALVFV